MKGQRTHGFDRSTGTAALLPMSRGVKAIGCLAPKPIGPADSGAAGRWVGEMTAAER